MFRVEVTDRARDEADAAYAWLAANVSDDLALRWYLGLFEQIETLGALPTRCPVAEESARFPEEVRELIYGKARHKHKYRILFTIHDDLVTVLTIQHSSRREAQP